MSNQDVSDAFDKIKHKNSMETKKELDNLDKMFAEGNIADELTTLQNDFSFFMSVALFTESCKRDKTPRKNALEIIDHWEKRIRHAWTERDNTLENTAGGFLLKMLSNSNQSSKDQEEALNRIVSDLKTVANQLPEKKEDTENKER